MIIPQISADITLSVVASAVAATVTCLNHFPTRRNVARILAKDEHNRAAGMEPDDYLRTSN